MVGVGITVGNIVGSVLGPGEETLTGFGFTDGFVLGYLLGYTTDGDRDIVGQALGLTVGAAIGPRVEEVEMELGAILGT